MNKGKTIFAQVMALVNEYELKKCVDHYKGDKHSIKFKCRDQFMAMRFGSQTVPVCETLRQPSTSALKTSTDRDPRQCPGSRLQK